MDWISVEALRFHGMEEVVSSNPTSHNNYQRRSGDEETQKRKPELAPPLMISDYEHGRRHLVPYRVDSVSEDQVLYSAMSVRAHHDEIGLDFPGDSYDLMSRTPAVGYGQLRVDAILLQ